MGGYSVIKCNCLPGCTPNSHNRSPTMTPHTKEEGNANSAVNTKTKPAVPTPALPKMVESINAAIQVEQEKEGDVMDEERCTSLPSLQNEGEKAKRGKESHVEDLPPRPPLRRAVSQYESKTTERPLCEWVFDDSLVVERGEDGVSPLKVVINSQSEMTINPFKNKGRDVHGN